TPRHHPLGCGGCFGLAVGGLLVARPGPPLVLPAVEGGAGCGDGVGGVEAGAGVVEGGVPGGDGGVAVGAHGVASPSRARRMREATLPSWHPAQSGPVQGDSERDSASISSASARTAATWASAAATRKSALTFAVRMARSRSRSTLPTCPNPAAARAWAASATNTQADP